MRGAGVGQRGRGVCAVAMGLPLLEEVVGVDYSQPQVTTCNWVGTRYAA